MKGLLAKLGIIGIIAVLVVISLNFSVQTAEKKKITGTFKPKQTISQTTVSSGAVLMLAAFSWAGDKVDPATVGIWQMMVPNAQGVATWIWEIRADGTYVFRSEGPGAAPSHSGTFTAWGGQWSLQSTTMDWSDGGTYQMLSQDIFVVTGKLGTGLWQRSSGGSSGGNEYEVQTEQIGNQRIPKSLLSFVSSAMPKARAWRKDAVLTELRVTPTDSARSNFGVQLHFYSPSDQTGLSIDSGMPFQYAVQEKGAVSWSTLPIPARFVDLPEAVLTAKQNGMTGMLRDALLIVHQPEKNAQILAWELMMVNGDHPYYVDAVSGQYLQHLTSGSGNTVAATPDRIQKLLLKYTVTSIYDEDSDKFSFTDKRAFEPSQSERKAGVVGKVVMRFKGKDRNGFIIFLLYPNHAAAEKGGDPELWGFIDGLTLKRSSGDIQAECYRWWEATVSETGYDYGYRCSRIDPILPVVIVGAESRPLEEGETTQDALLYGPGTMLSIGIDFLSDIVKKEIVGQ